MIFTLLRLQWLALMRDRLALVLTFVLPIIFFSIFASIFGGASDDGGLARIPALVLDADRSTASGRLVAALEAENGLRVTRLEDTEEAVEAAAAGSAIDRDFALDLVRRGAATLVVVLPPGFGEEFGAFGPEAPAVELLADTADPIAAEVVGGLLQGVAMTAAPDFQMRRGMEALERYAGPLTERQREVTEAHTQDLATSPPEPGSGFGGPINVEVVDVLAESADGRRKSAGIAYQAAGIGVMFLLFSMAGAAGSLLEEEESGTLERVLTADIGMGRLLLGKWLFFAVLGTVQVATMFLWGWAIFGIDLFTPRHFVGFALMAVVTAAAAAAFGLVLAAFCRSRAQLSGVSTLVILIMSAVGGSMMPRFLMPPLMKKAGFLTFNAWAIDGFQKVFWYEAGPLALWPQVTVLVAATLTFLAAARWLARRWETA